MWYKQFVKKLILTIGQRSHLFLNLTIDELRTRYPEYNIIPITGTRDHWHVIKDEQCIGKVRLMEDKHNFWAGV
jgi:hypothetical protein